MDNRLIEQIKSRLPITEVLSTYITLEPSGTQYKARCPFHNEKTASFSVSPERGLFYCFGCGAKGDIFTFVERFEGMDFKGALKILADRAGIPLTAGTVKVDPTDSVYEALEQATKKYHEILMRTPDALEYLKKRGVTEETIAQFRIGYAPTEWRTISSALDAKGQGFYERAGLIKPAVAKAMAAEEKPRYYDRFRGRIMFPMMDGSGRVVAFSGRRFPDVQSDSQESPKYLNSPETEVFQKSRVLFGFDKAKGFIKKNNFAILVEGQMDLILSHQAGFKNTVATSGTAVSETVIGDSGAQLSVIARLTPNIFFAFDGDSAGQKAMERAALVALSLGMNPKVVSLPEGVDPADFIATGGSESVEGWKGLLKNAEHFIPHTLHAILATATSAHQLQEQLRKRLFPFLLRVTSPIERQLYIQTIASESNLGVEEVQDELNLFRAQHANQRAASQPMDNELSTDRSGSLSHEERFAAIVELYPSEIVLEYKKKLDEFSFEGSPLPPCVIADHHREAVLAKAEREYGGLSQEQREEIVKELSQIIINQFFETLRFNYTVRMSKAKSDKDEEGELHFLALLQKLHQRKHDV